MSATSTTGRAALVAANGRARRPAEPPQGDLSHAEAQRDRERRDFWFGEVPDGWEVRKIKFTFSERKQKGYPELPLLAATQNHGVILKNKYENRTVEAIKGLESLKLVEIGDFVISLRSFQGGLELAHDRGIISPAYTILMPTHITREYFKYYAKSPTFIALLRSTVTGIREGQNIDYNKLREYSIPIPPKETQLTIAAYLDAETGRIDKAIAAEEKMIALLQERREIVINEAVGGGDLSHAEAQRGRERRGWEVRRLKFIFEEILDGSHFSPETTDVGYAYVTATDVRGIGIDFSKTRKISESNYLRLCAAGCQIHEGDVLLVKDGATTGRVGLMMGKEPCVALSSVAMLRQSKHHNKYLMFMLSSDYIRKQIILSMAGSAMPRITIEKLKEFWGLLPPLPEQEAIVERLDRETGKIDRAIEVKRRQIELLRERRQIVIDEVVTGKVKVA